MYSISVCPFIHAGLRVGCIYRSDESLGLELPVVTVVYKYRGTRVD
jgi:hypothetical protein